MSFICILSHKPSRMPDTKTGRCFPVFSRKPQNSVGEKRDKESAGKAETVIIMIAVIVVIMIILILTEALLLSKR